MFYAISPNGDVRSFKKIAHATDAATEVKGWVGSDATETDTGLTNVPTAMLVTLHNIIRPEKPVVRFSDRETGEKRLKGVLEVLSKPGELPAPSEAPAADVEEEFTPDPALSAEENEAMAAKKKAAKKTTAKKAPAAKKEKATRAPAKEISEAIVKKCIARRAKGDNWTDICNDLGEPLSFTLKVRPLMKKLDKSSVAKIGPGSPNYGKGKAK
jgi:hypothetical protein